MDRNKVEKTILENSKEGRLPCALCFKIAEDLGISKKELGELLNDLQIKVGQCQLGCFD